MASLKLVWFRTAASSGFGHELAHQALKRGHTVIATARNPSKINDLRDAGAHIMALDVTAPQSMIESVAHEVEKRFGKVDYLMPVAGYILDAAVEEATPEEEQA